MWKSVVDFNKDYWDKMLAFALIFFLLSFILIAFVPNLFALIVSIKVGGVLIFGFLTAGVQAIWPVLLLAIISTVLFLALEFIAGSGFAMVKHCYEQGKEAISLEDTVGVGVTTLQEPTLKTEDEGQYCFHLLKKIEPKPAQREDSTLLETNVELEEGSGCILF